MMVLSENETKFLNASEMGNLEIIKSLTASAYGEPLILLSRHDKIRNEDGWTALIYASWKGHLEVVRFLIKEKSVDINQKSNDGKTALYVASLNGYVDVMKCLIDKGANVNQQENCGWAPLHRASRWGYLSAVQLLLKNGADPLMKDKYNETALDFTRHTDIANAIVQHILQQNQKLIQCQYELSSGVWPNALSRLNSVGLIFRLVCGVPHLFQEASEKASQQDNHQMPRFTVLHHPDCPACQGKRVQ